MPYLHDGLILTLPTEKGLVHLSGQFSAGCEAPICRAFLLIHSAFGYGFVESRNIWGLSLGRNFDRKGERGPEKNESFHI
jgi:hypothetical protein